MNESDTEIWFSFRDDNEINKGKFVYLRCFKAEWEEEEATKEFEKDYQDNKFKEFFMRVIADVDGNGLCGLYEEETVYMLWDAFQNSTEKK